jgi:hypothetical protein
MKKRSEEGEARRMAALREALNRPETREKHRRLWDNPEYRSKVTEAAKKRKHTEESKEKMRVVQKEICNEPVFKANKQKIYDKPEWHEKMSNIVRESWNDPAVRKNRTRGLKEAFKRPGVLAKISGENSNFYRHGNGYCEYPKEFSPGLKEFVRGRDERMCQMPGCYLYQTEKKFPVHHIDYNRNNNNPSNLITLCVKCHVETTLGDREYFELLLNELQIQRGLGSAGF